MADTTDQNIGKDQQNTTSNDKTGTQFQGGNKGQGNQHWNDESGNLKGKQPYKDSDQSPPKQL